MNVSVVVPVFDEAGVLLELATRCLDAARQVDPDAEVILVDDASTDATPTLADRLPEGVRLHRLPHNRGQLGATKVGLSLATRDLVVVLDGDLQDPPELIPALVRALRDAPEADVVFAVKSSRQDSGAFVVARAVFDVIARLPGSRVVPSGAGAYCAMRRPLARRAADVGVEQANLASVLVALGARSRTLPYAKAARYDGASRVGALGLVREGVGSLVLTGAVTTAARGLAIAALATAVWRRRAGGAAVAAALLALATISDRSARRALATRRET